MKFKTRKILYWTAWGLLALLWFPILPVLLISIFMENGTTIVAILLAWVLLAFYLPILFNRIDNAFSEEEYSQRW